MVPGCPTHAPSGARSSVEAAQAAPPAAKCAASPPPPSLTPSHRPPIATRSQSWRWTRPTPVDGAAAGGSSPSTSPADSAATATRPLPSSLAGEARDTARSDEAGCTRADQRIGKGERPPSRPLTELVWPPRRATTGVSTYGMQRPPGRNLDPRHAQAFNTVRDTADRTIIYRIRNGTREVMLTDPVCVWRRPFPRGSTLRARPPNRR